MKLRPLPLVVALALAAGSAAAQTSPPLRESLTEDARPQFDEATALYERAAYAAAREAFLAAYAKSAEPRLLYNAAVCDKALGRYARAIQTLRASLAASDRPLPEDYRRRVNESIATLSKYVAFVTIASNVDGAAFTVDGEAAGENPVALDAGSHAIVASKEGYEPASQTLTVKAGEAERVLLTLTPSRTASLTITCGAAVKCSILVDGEPVGQAPVKVSRAAGSHDVRAFVDGALYDERRVDVEDGRALAVHMSGSARSLARLRVVTDDPSDTVTIDGKPVGQSGVDVELTAGEHHVMIARSGGPSRSIDVLLRPNETRDLRLTLEEKKGGVSAWWFVGGGVLAAGAAALGIFLATRPTTFEGSSAGTLNPFVVPASTPGGL